MLVGAWINNAMIGVRGLNVVGLTTVLSVVTGGGCVAGLDVAFHDFFCQRASRRVLDCQPILLVLMP